MLTLLLAVAAAKAPLNMRGTFVEACSCNGTCAYEVSGENPFCNSMGAYHITHGTYDGKDISGISIGFVVSQPGNLCYLYGECPPSKTDITKRLAFKIFGSYGKTQGMHAAHIRIQPNHGQVGNYRLSFDGGEIASVQIAPVMGGDGKTPVVLHNVYGDPYDELYQAKAIDGSFNHPGHGFLLKNSNAYYIADLKIDKRI